jgi:type IV pilus assembly protein PilW
MSNWVNKRGVTLLELLVAMAIIGVVMASIYSVYNTHQKSYAVQEQIVTMQQNLRAAIFIMERDIRMAGYDPYGNSGAGITATVENSFSFTIVADDDSYDNDGDGPVDEAGELKTITYSLYDSGGDGDNDLGRKVGAGNNQPVAENIDALNFVYLKEDGGPTTNLSEIRSIQITIVARTGREDPGYTDTKAYYNQQDQDNPILPAQNDNVRRKRLTTEVKCRNLGL